MESAIRKFLPKGFPAFVMVGGIGFVVDAAILAILVHGYEWGNYSARVASFAVAVTITWVLNRRYAFAEGQSANRKQEYTRYLAVQGSGMAINFLVYSLCIATSTLMNTWPVLALAVGSAVALIFNYAGARMFVFTGDKNSG